LVDKIARQPLIGSGSYCRLRPRSESEIFQLVIGAGQKLDRKTNIKKTLATEKVFTEK
jgi:hypothetical protein